MVNQDTLADLDGESPPPGEAEDIEACIRLIQEIMSIGPRPILRGQHAKSTGDVKARLIVDPDRPSETRFGIFESDRTFDAIVRFSNGAGTMNPDTRGDARGMAIKVLGVSGPRAFEEDGETDTQDFVMINFPQFPVRNAHEYRKFMESRLKYIRLLGPAGNAIGQLLFFVPFRVGQFLRVGRKLIGTSRSPLVERYWSMSPYRLGARAIKFSLVPQPVNSEALSANPARDVHSADQLSRALADHLRAEPARFDFVVQFRNDPKSMPIEDPTVLWDEAISKPVKVATLIIDQADLNSAESIAFRKQVESMSFNPWHSLEAHRPLGGINRLRKRVYQESTTLRRESVSQ